MVKLVLVLVLVDSSPSLVLLHVLIGESRKYPSFPLYTVSILMDGAEHLTPLGLETDGSKLWQRRSGVHCRGSWTVHYEHTKYILILQ